MPQGRTRSRLSESERKERAAVLFDRGWKNADIARELDVTPDTVKRYRDKYETDLRETAQRNPRLLINILENTVRGIQELDEQRRQAWDDYEACDAGSTNRIAAMRVLVAIGDQRNKLFGLFGVKQEYFLKVQSVQNLQNRLIEFMRTNLCAEDRVALETFIQNDLAELISDGSIPAINAAVPPPVESPA